MTELKTVVLVLVVFGLALNMGLPFYNNFQEATGKSTVGVAKIKSISDTAVAPASTIIAKSKELVENKPQSPLDIAFIIPSIFLSIATSIISLVISVPATILQVMSTITSDLIGFTIPPEFLTTIFIILAISVFFGIAKFLGGRGVN